MVDLKSKLALIVLNYKDYGTTINSVNNLIERNNEFNIVVVDNNSPNESFDIISKRFISHKNISVIKSDKNGGYSYGNNFGIKYILDKVPSIEYIAIMNPDVIIPYEDLFCSLIKKIDVNSNIIGIAPVPLLNNCYDLRAIAWKLPQKIDKFFINLSYLKRLYNPIVYKSINTCSYDKSIGYVDVLPGSFFIIKRSNFEEMGFFDENLFLYEEENVLAAKAKKLGYHFTISINDYYIHNHEEKEEKLNDMEYKRKDFIRVLESQKYYVLNYMINGKIYWPIIAFSAYFHLYIEIPVNHLIKKIIKIVRA